MYTVVKTSQTEHLISLILLSENYTPIKIRKPTIKVHDVIQHMDNALSNCTHETCVIPVHQRRPVSLTTTTIITKERGVFIDSND